MNGMVVAAQPEAAEAGVEVLRRGGNAVVLSMPVKRNGGIRVRFGF